WIEADEGRPSLRIRIWLTVPWPLNPYNLSLWETVVLANSRLTHGAFRFNPDGSIEYDYTLRTMGQVPDPDALRGLIRECVAMVDRYCAAFESVALGFSYSSDAIPEVEWMSRAGHVHGTTAGFGGGRPIPDSYRVGSFPLFAGAYPYAGK